MIESESYKLRYGQDNFSERFAVLKEISSQNTLIIIENYDNPDDDIKYLSEISAANILMTTTIPAIDLSDYGIENIIDIS